MSMLYLPKLPDAEYSGTSLLSCECSKVDETVLKVAQAPGRTCILQGM